MCIGVWLEIECSGCKGCWVQSPVVNSGCRGGDESNFFLEIKNKTYLIFFPSFIVFSFSPVLLASFTRSLAHWFCWYHRPLFSEFSVCVCVTLFCWPDIGESLRSRGYSLNQGTWGGRILTLHLNYVAGYTGPLLFLFERTQLWLMLLLLLPKK